MLITCNQGWYRTSDCQVWVNPQPKNAEKMGLRKKIRECQEKVLFTVEKSHIEAAWLSVGSFISDQKFPGFNLESIISKLETLNFSNTFRKVLE
jgi:hypothetical protein